MSSQTAAQVFQGIVCHSGTREEDFDLVPMSVHDMPPYEESGYRVIGEPEMAARVLWVSEDKCMAVVVEKCGPCKVIGRHANDVFYLMRGRWTARRPDGTEYEVKAGDFACYREGQEEECTVHETFVKFAMYHSAKPLPYKVTH